jgi:hypothetical protein
MIRCSLSLPSFFTDTLERLRFSLSGYSNVSFSRADSITKFVRVAEKSEKL